MTLCPERTRLLFEKGKENDPEFCKIHRSSAAYSLPLDPLEELGDLWGERVGLLAAHIWPHLDQIAHCEDQLPGDRLSVSSPGGHSVVFTLLPNNARDCMCNSLEFFSFSFFISE